MHQTGQPRQPNGRITRSQHPCTTRRTDHLPVKASIAQQLKGYPVPNSEFTGLTSGLTDDSSPTSPRFSSADYVRYYLTSTAFTKDIVQ